MKESAITIESLLQIIDKQAKEICDLKKEIADLKEKLDYLIRQKFAPSSERVTTPEPALDEKTTSDIEVVEDTQEEKIKSTRHKRGNKQTPPDSLPHVRVEHDISEEEKICSCGCEMQRIREIVSQQYDIIPATFRVINNVRFVYACSCGCGEAPTTTQLTPQVLPKHQVTASFLATIAVQKFEDALPLYRQVKIYKSRFGIDFTTTTFAQWMIKTSELRLEKFVERLSTIQLLSDYIQADETTLQVLNEENKTAKSKSYIWIQISGGIYPIVRMYYSPNRAGDTAELLFEGFNGYLQTDGYAGYNVIANREDVTQLGCWAHARRKFADIIKSDVSDVKSKNYAKKLVAQVSELYKIEENIKNDPPDVKKARREKESSIILKEIKLWLDTNFIIAQTLGGAIARAFVYLNNQFVKLSVYLQDGRLAIDNNNAERHVKPVVMGRKNWLFANSEKGATALSNWYTVIETAKVNGLDPYAYLCHILTLLPIYEKEGKDIEDLLPWNVALAKSF